MEMTRSELAQAQKLMGQLQKILEKKPLNRAKLRRLKAELERKAVAK